jgi:hypothetical protein
MITRIANSAVVAALTNATVVPATGFQPTALRPPVTTVRNPSSMMSPLDVVKNKFAAPLRMAPAESEISSSPVVGTGTGTATIPNEVFNLVKSIVGAGVLSLPAGIAAFGNAPSAIFPAVALISIIGGFSAYGFSLIGRVCSYTGGQSYRGAWSKCVGDETSWIPGK